MEKSNYLFCTRSIKKKTAWKRQENVSKITGNWKKTDKIDYEIYRYTILEWIKEWLKATGIILFASYIFYRSIWAFVILFPLSFLWPVLVRNPKKKKRKDILNGQFKEMMMSLSSALGAGYSVENAFHEAYTEIASLYGKNSLMAVEIKNILGGLDLNVPIENLLKDLGDRSGLEDIRNFAEVFRITKRTSGDLPLVIRNTVMVIEEKIRVREEIITLTASVRYEGMVMDFIPAGIILYMGITAGDFFMVLYTTIWGRCFMTACMVMYALVILWQQKMLEIEI